MDIDISELENYLESYLGKINKNVKIEVDIKDSNEQLESESSTIKIDIDEVNSDIQFDKFKEEIHSIVYSSELSDGSFLHVQVHGFSQDVVYLFDNKREMSFVYYLIDRSVEEYLSENKLVLLKKRSLSSKMIEYADEFLVNLCKSIMQGDTIDRENIFVNYMESISNMNYEGESLKSKVLILNEQDIKEHVDIIISFETKEYFKEERKIRKMLEMSSEKIFVIADFYKVYGLGTIKDFGEADKKNLENRLLIINFKNKLDYSIHKADFIKKITQSVSKDNQTTQTIDWQITEKILLGFSHNTLYVDEKEFPYNILKSQLKNVFKPYFHVKGYNDSEMEVHVSKIIEIVLSASRQKHGTMIVITNPDIAIEEIKRLNTQCICIKSFDLLTSNNIFDRDILLNQITKIDGAIYLDIEGKCHALGVILDGIASNNGSNSRGARYNSGIKYGNFNEVKNKCVIVVISEDGMIDVIGKELIDSDLAINELNIRINNGEYEESIERLNELIKDDEYNPRYYHLRAKCYTKIEDSEKAIEDYNSLINLNPSNLDFFLNSRGVLYFLKGQNFEALKDFDESIKINSTKATSYSNRARVKVELKQYEDALRDCDTAISLNKKKEEAYYTKGWIFLKENKINDAIEVISDGINNIPNALKLFYARGRIYMSNGEKENALADFEKVASLKPDYLDVNSKIIEVKNMSN